MKKLFVGLIVLSIFLCSNLSWSQKRPIPPPTPTMFVDSNCDQVQYQRYRVICQDSDDGKIYYWNGAAMTEFAAGEAGDMTLAAFDADLDGFIDADAGGTDIDSSALTGTPYVTAGTWSVKSAADEMTALGFTANAQTLIAETFAQMQGSLSIDDLITLSGVAEGEPDLGTFTGTTIADDQTIKQGLQALETALELRATIANPTFTGVVTIPNDGLHVLDTNATHDLIITPGSDLTADRILTITTGDEARTLTIEADSIVNQDLSSDGNPSFSTANLVGANALTLGTASTNAGSIALKNATNANVFTILSGVSGAAIGWTLPTAAPGGANYILNVDADGTMGYTDPSTITGLVSDCSASLCLDGSADGGTYIRLYDGDSNYTQLAAANTAANPVITLPNATSTLIGEGIATGGLIFGDSSPDAAGEIGYAANVVQVYDGTAARTVMFLQTDQTITSAALTVGDADTDTLTLRSLLLGGNSRAVQITDSIAAPTYATGNTSLYVKSYIESAAGMYAPFFDSVLTAGNVGYVRVKEDPTNGTNFRGIEAPSILTQDLTWVFPDGNPSAYDFPVFGAVAANKTPITYTTLPELLDAVLGNTQGNVLYRNDTTWTVLAVGSAGQALTSGGAAANVSWEDVTATAAGDTKGVQYNDTDALASEAAFTYDPATNTLNVTVEGANPALTTGDGTYTMGHTPQVYIEGIAEVDGMLYADGGVTGNLTGNASGSAATLTGTLANVAVSTSANLATCLSDEQGTGVAVFSNSPTFVDDITLGAAGVKLTGADGDLTILGLGDGFDEDLTIDLDTTENQATVSSSTGVTLISLTSIGITTGAASDLSAGAVTLGTISGAIDAGAATSFEVPNGDNPTTNAAGEIAMDTTAGAIQGLNVYANATPGAVRVPFYFMAPSITVKGPDANSDYPYLFTPYAITLRSVSYICVDGTSWTGQLQICDADYGSCGDTQAADTTAAAGTTTTVTSFSDGTVPAGVWMGLKTQSVIGTITSMTVQATYTVDQQ